MKKQKKWRDGENDEALYTYDIEPENQTLDLVLTNEGINLVNSFGGITFKSEPDEDHGQLEFDDKSDAIDFLKEYRKYQVAYEKLETTKRSLERTQVQMDSLKQVNEELNGNIAALFTKLKKKDEMLKEAQERNDYLLKSQNTFLFVIDSLKKKYEELKQEYELLEETNLNTEDQLLGLRRYLDIDYNLSNFDYDDIGMPQTLPMDYCDNDEEPTSEDELMTDIHNNQRERMEINDDLPKQLMDPDEIMKQLTPEEFMEWRKDNYQDEEINTETALKLTDQTLNSLRESIRVTFDDVPHYRLNGYMPPIPEEPLKEKEAEKEVEEDIDVQRELSLYPEDPKDAED